MTQFPSQFELLHYLEYAPQTGALIWRERPSSMFLNGPHSAEHQAAKWNSAHAGNSAVAFAANGYGYVTINSRKYLSHRIAWKIAFNTEPKAIDHINGDRIDNRLLNLRAADRPENMKNMKRPKNNTSGAIGVSYRADRNAWRAYIRVGGKHTSLGHFDTYEAAVAARQAASKKHGYHANHGR